ncbi:MAG: ATP-binding protein [Bacteroidia bacterium]|nr:ATP-binding protein [Bacteroidia bacterium]
MKSYLRVRCNKKFLATIRDFVKKKLADMDINGRVSHQIVLAVDEACANCMIHQHQCDNLSTLEITIYKKDNTLYTEIKDPGKAFPMHTYQPEQLQEIIKKRAKGGLGISLIHKIMDEIQVEQESNYSLYRLGKNLEA